MDAPHRASRALPVRATIAALSACVGLACTPSAGDGGDAIAGASPPTPGAGAIRSPAGVTGASSGPRHPFALHDFAYAQGTMLPSASAADRDAATGAFYDAWKSKYLSAACGDGTYYVDMRADDARKLYGGMDPSSISISEGHGYGMTIVAWMAGWDADARTVFDGMVRFYLQHGAASDPALMGWDQVLGCGASPNGGDGTATDGDLDVAFALLLADAQWGSDGAFDYRSMALGMIAAIRAREIDEVTSLPTLGDWVTPDLGKYVGAVRTSDLVPAHFRAFAAASGVPAWQGSVDASYALLSTMQAKEAPATGLVADFVLGTHDAPYSAPPYFVGGPMDGAYGFNACRVPWRIAMDALVNGEVRARSVVARIDAFARAKTGGDPSLVRGGYALYGDPLRGTTPSELAFVAPLGVGAIATGDDQAWVDAIWSWLVERPIDDDPYYGNTLKMLSMIAMSGNAWTLGARP